MTMDERFRALLAGGDLDLPVLGGGESPARLDRLREIARLDVSVARVAEAHVDAVQILHEAGRDAQPGVWYGVWASDDPSTSLALRRAGGSTLVIEGTKGFCTGASLVDRALVTVETPDRLLIDIDMRGSRADITADASSWISPAFAETGTALVEFRSVAVGEHDIVGPPDWYLDRPGFWNGACGPAACWAGGAQGLVDWAVDRSAAGRASTHRDVAVGALSSLASQMEAVLEHAGRQMDEDPDDAAGARIRALQVRHSVERACAEILDRLGRAFGPRPLAFDASVQQRYLEVQLYIRQCHAERDLEALGMCIRDRELSQAADREHRRSQLG